MKKITQEYVKGIKEHNGFAVIKTPVVSEGVANWFEENKEELEQNIWKYIYYFDDYMQDIDDFPVFISNCLEKPLETLIAMQYGYYVEKEIREGDKRMNIFGEEFNLVYKAIKTEEQLNNFFDNMESSSIFTEPMFLYVLKCQLAVDPNLENEIREEWKKFRKGES
ncbi:DUF1642 domain-containing protein [Listeria innocua]|uniref:DUF1642 domain-containing protein n=1 Tax=Listeria innocua TaxID=1642 RepID=UPI00162ACCA8|nr:DUF1642 domain-containing protein [Listeria innocua]MBC1353805.1 DUF1642 domain-containing protein [Listeria innocua]